MINGKIHDWKTIQEEIWFIDLEIERLSREDDTYQLESYLNEPKQYKNVIFLPFQNTQEKDSYNFTTYSDMNTDSIINIFSLKNVEFIECDFLDITDFSKYHFFKSVKFEKCRFIKGILFSKTFENHLEFNNCNFCLNSIDLSNRIFKSSLHFKDCRNIGKIDLYNSTIQGSASFKGSNINEVNFARTDFNNVAVFNDAIFQNNVDFKYTSFEKRVYFQNIMIQGELNLSSTIFKDEVNFLGIKNNDVGQELGTKNIANRETARIIKHSFEKLDNIIEANKFYTLEMQKREEELSKTKEKNWLDLIVFKFHKISSNHSQDWLLALFWMLNISILYTHYLFFMVDKKIEYFVIPFVLNVLTTIMVGFDFSKVCKLLWTLTSYLIYIFISHDYFLCFVANNFNPFSIMTETETFTFAGLIYKSIITYLIYQFIISIRQNTRIK